VAVVVRDGCGDVTVVGGGSGGGGGGGVVVVEVVVWWWCGRSRPVTRSIAVKIH